MPLDRRCLVCPCKRHGLPRRMQRGFCCTLSDAIRKQEPHAVTMQGLLQGVHQSGCPRDEHACSCVVFNSTTLAAWAFVAYDIHVMIQHEGYGMNQSQPLPARYIYGIVRIMCYVHAKASLYREYNSRRHQDIIQCARSFLPNASLDPLNHESLVATSRSRPPEDIRSFHLPQSLCLPTQLVPLHSSSSSPTPISPSLRRPSLWCTSRYPRHCPPSCAPPPSTDP